MPAIEDDTIDGEMVVRASSDTVLGTLTKAETDMQITTAKAYPRSIKRFRNEVLSLVTLNEDVAGECMYALPRAGKSIEGPSARFAEVILSCWGNCHGGARVVSEDDKFVVAQGAIWDLERNNKVTFEVRRRITNKAGKRYDDDMIGVTGSAAASIAFRNSVLKVIPKAFWNDLYMEARKCAIGDIKTLGSKRAIVVDKFAKLGVTLPMLLSLLDKAGIEDVDLDDLAILRGTYTAIKDEGASIESVFNKPVEGSKVSKSTISAKAPETKPQTVPRGKTQVQQSEPEIAGTTDELEHVSEPPGGFEEPQQSYDDEGSQETDILSDLLRAAEDTSILPAKVTGMISKAMSEGLIDRGEADQVEFALQERINRVKAGGGQRRTRQKQMGE